MITRMTLSSFACVIVLFALALYLYLIMYLLCIRFVAIRNVMLSLYNATIETTNHP